MSLSPDALKSSSSFLRVSVTALRSDHFPPRLHMFRNYPAPYERMERLVSELIEARSSSFTSTDSSVVAAASTDEGVDRGERHVSSKKVETVDKKTDREKNPSNNESCSTMNEKASSTNQISSEVPCKLLLTSFLRQLFGETLREVGHGNEDESDLQESIVSLLSSFSRRYMYGSKGVEQSVPTNEQVSQWSTTKCSSQFHISAYFYPIRAFGNNKIFM